jgi:Arc-like DNA binding domain
MSSLAVAGRFVLARKLTDTVQLKLRFEEGLRRRLEREAASHNCSMNAEIVSRLQASFEQPMLTKLMENAVMGALIKYHAKPQDPQAPPAPGGILGDIGQPKSKKGDAS